MKDHVEDTANSGKFKDLYRTAKGEERASVALAQPETLWFNTGTLCNIACVNCYIESSPTNDRLVYLTAGDVTSYLDELQERQWGAREIGFTGGEPFMNPDILAMLDDGLARGFDVLVLTNAMAPMMRPRVQEGLRDLNTRYGPKLTLRVSLDHWSATHHEAERGKGTFERCVRGMRWLRDEGLRMTVAGRTMWGEPEANARDGYAALFEREGFGIDASHPGETVLFPEMDETVEVPEITTACWGILGKTPASVMCASSRMVVKRKGAKEPAVVACTLLPYAPEFELGPRLKDAEGAVHLNHPHCAKFCVLGGASCSA